MWSVRHLVRDADCSSALAVLRRVAAGPRPRLVSLVAGTAKWRSRDSRTMSARNAEKFTLPRSLAIASAHSFTVTEKLMLRLTTLPF